MADEITGDFFLYPTRLGRPWRAEGAPADLSLELLDPAATSGSMTNCLAHRRRRSPRRFGEAWHERAPNRGLTPVGNCCRKSPLPEVHVALDDVILEEDRSSRRPPSDFGAWAAAVIIGRFLSRAREVERTPPRKWVYRWRRLSGGGAMFVQPGLTITYSLYMPERLLAGMSIAASYAVADSWVVDAFRSLGVPAQYVPLNDIAAPEGKIGGAAQLRRRGFILHHTTIAYEMSADDMLRVLRIGREKLSDKGTASAAKRVSPLQRHTSLPRTAIVNHLVGQFRERFGLEESSLTSDEYAAAQARVAERFGTFEWTGDLP